MPNSECYDSLEPDPKANFVNTIPDQQPRAEVAYGPGRSSGCLGGLPCPNCGYCPCCGRYRWPTFFPQPAPVYPAPYISPSPFVPRQVVTVNHSGG